MHIETIRITTMIFSQLMINKTDAINFNYSPFQLISTNGLIIDKLFLMLQIQSLKSMLKINFEN
jgi:hypothetical protein